MEIEYKSIPATFEVKAAEDGKMLHIKAYGAGINNVDRVGDLIPPSAFDGWLASEDKARCQLCYQHKYEEIIGKFDYDSFSVDENGLLFEADLLPTSWGKNAQVLIEAGLLNEFSIGYYPIKYHYDSTIDGDIRVLDEVALKEISIVTIPANPKATLISAKDTDGAKDDLSKKTDEELDALAAAIEDEKFARFINNL